MAFVPVKNRYAVLALALWLGLGACAPSGPALTAVETDAPPVPETPAATAAPTVTAAPKTPSPTAAPTFAPEKTATPSPLPETPAPEPSPSPLYAIQVAAPTAEDLTGRCRMDASNGIRHYIWRMNDASLHSSQILKSGQWVSLTWEEDVPVKTVYLAFKDYPDTYRIRQFDADGALLQEEAGPRFLNQILALAPGARTVTLLSEGGVDLAAMYAYGAGTVPNDHPWAPTPEKLDYLMVVTHPDDDVLFLGAIVPLYTVDQGREGSIYYAAAWDRIRKDEAQNGAWVMGLRTAPILDSFPDIAQQYREKRGHLFTENQVVLRLVRLLRQYRPEVVFSQDINGEYGHWQHALLSNALRKAVSLAARKGYDPASIREYGPWRVKKLYLHLYAKNKISLPVQQPIAAYGGLTPVEIATAAYRCHQSQQTTGHAVRNEGIYSLSDFGLAYTAVGPDTPGVNDPFEHIDPTTIHGIGTTP